MRDLNTSAVEINDDLKKIEAWAHQWKIGFNPNPLKQAAEVIFSRKRNKPHHLDIIFNSNPVKKSSYQKHSGMLLDSKLAFDEHIKEFLIKLVSLLVLFASSEIFYGDHLFYKSINLLLDLT